jgi:uncharacterized protein (TIGR02145 family)
MPDNKWWLAQNLKYAGTGAQANWCTKDECGRLYTQTQAKGSSGYGANQQGICPAGWFLPVVKNYQDILNAYSATVSEHCKILTPLDSKCPTNDHYGLAALKSCVQEGDASVAGIVRLYVNDAADVNDYEINDILGYTPFDCGYAWVSNNTILKLVRCIRQL